MPKIARFEMRLDDADRARIKTLKAAWKLDTDAQVVRVALRKAEEAEEETKPASTTGPIL